MIRQTAGALRAHAAKLVLTGFLALPMAAAVLWPVDPSVERRELAPAAGRPQNIEEALAWPAKAEAWVNDHFGWRPQMVTGFARLRYALFERFPTTRIVAGSDDRLFLVAHDAQGERYKALVACGWQFDRRARVLNDLNRFERTMRARGIPGKLLVVPSAPAVYREQMPAWAAERCDPDKVPMAGLLKAPELSPAARSLVYFPLHEMRAMRERVTLFPKNFFHWGNAGAGAVAALAEQHFWRRGLETGTPINLVARDTPSDVGFMFPGIERNAMVEHADFAGSTITPCYGPDCFPEIKPIMDKLYLIGRYVNSAPGLGPRLVLVTDSFGYNALPMFARYHREVVLVGTNALESLSQGELARLRALLFVPGSDDEVLFLYHDATVLANRIDIDFNMLFPEGK
ncbi:hypothetical protein LQ564_13300 [Massilia sp. G4R7]|uniref:AlgX/AlgJ SGNH hydrolase-like domain-containing protein n=1 Tax=Massilia phyllostachyos TaxID=2898585 RepID=A0ABS8Q6R7_9BURK|nr:hypothetical protein [Massilia phyllostachyos]MCD2517284.1 hypothetical protein [Massilia phyllostachyos]